MGQRVFVKVVGFSDVERHALNTLFRLSEEAETSYALWSPGSPEQPKLALVDAFSHEAHIEAQSRQTQGETQLIWIGAEAPPHAWRSFERPLHWAPVLHAMDELFAPPIDFDVSMPSVIDIDLESGSGAEGVRRALIANQNLDERLYLRAKMVLLGCPVADEAPTALGALALMRMHTYDVEFIDLDMPDMDGWQFLKKAIALHADDAKLIVTTENAGWLTRMKAHRAGAYACLGKPVDPYAINRLLRKREQQT